MPSYPEWIMERSFGGTQVADAPVAGHGSGLWPTGDSAPAARECCDLLVDWCNAGKDPDESMLVFLVGGAGNGKSYLAKDVVRRLYGKRIGEQGRFARRLYNYSLGNGGRLDVINDATIPPDGQKKARDFLIRDVESVLHRGGNLLACVNRGVLVSELNNRDPQESGGMYELAARLVQWLLEGKDGWKDDSCPGWALEVVPTVAQAGYYKCCRLSGPNGLGAIVHVAFMDQVSLLEPYPSDGCKRGAGANDPLIPGRLRLAPILGNGRMNPPPPAHKVLASFFKEAGESCLGQGYPGGDLDPVQANLRALCDEEVLRGLCSVLRGAEVISGNHLTYRDLWGIGILAAMGPVVAGDLPASASRIRDLADMARDGSLGPAGRLAAVVELASRRFHMALFAAPLPVIADMRMREPSHPTAQAMGSLRMADPLVSLRGDDAKKVRDKLLLLDEKGFPGKSLAEDDPLFRRAWGPLDQLLEDTLIEWLYCPTDPPGLTERNELLYWYGHYLFRLFALVHGSPGHADLVQEWQEIWNKVQSPPKSLLRGLTQLVFKPEIEDGLQTTYLPLLSPRVTPFHKGEDGKRVTVKIMPNHYNWALETRGDSIIAKLVRQGMQGSCRAELFLDFPLLREAYANSEGDGFTEGAVDVEPRVERLRAEILSIEREVAQSQYGTTPSIAFIDGSNVVN